MLAKSDLKLNLLCLGGSSRLMTVELAAPTVTFPFSAFAERGELPRVIFAFPFAAYFAAVDRTEEFFLECFGRVCLEPLCP